MYAVPQFFVEKQALNAEGKVAGPGEPQVYEVWNVFNDVNSFGAVFFSCLSEEQATAIANALNMEDFYNGDVTVFDE